MTKSRELRNCHRPTLFVCTTCRYDQSYSSVTRFFYKKPKYKKPITRQPKFKKLLEVQGLRNLGNFYAFFYNLGNTFFLHKVNSAHYSIYAFCAQKPISLVDITKDDDFLRFVLAFTASFTVRGPSQEKFQTVLKLTRP